KGLTRLIAPARIPDEQTEASQTIALRAHQELGCDGVSRVDMHIDREGRCWVHEINSVPGMTETSDLPAAAAAAGIGYDELVLIILESAVARM
ncbi:MAG: D-alanine--D-alanine ligase, partial [Armatimonadetes bacterium]|nr:D-alanine--D-alanine ligase [Armatimonadota bacterium]